MFSSIHYCNENFIILEHLSPSSLYNVPHCFITLSKYYFKYGTRTVSNEFIKVIVSRECVPYTFRSMPAIKHNGLTARRCWCWITFSKSKLTHANTHWPRAGLLPYISNMIIDCMNGGCLRDSWLHVCVFTPSCHLEPCFLSTFWWARRNGITWD